MEKTPTTILLVEDDLNECEIYKNILTGREDIKLVAITNSSAKAIEEMQIHKPDAVILDLELTDGEGSGFEFIESVRFYDSVTNGLSQFNNFSFDEEIDLDSSSIGMFLGNCIKSLYRVFSHPSRKKAAQLCGLCRVKWFP